jgi:G3E family GTPase
VGLDGLSGLTEVYRGSTFAGRGVECTVVLQVSNSRWSQVVQRVKASGCRETYRSRARVSLDCGSQGLLVSQGAFVRMNSMCLSSPVAEVDERRSASTVIQINRPSTLVDLMWDLP